MELAEKEHETVSEAQWLVARKDLLRREKEFRKTQEAMRYLESELVVLKRIKHQHFVRYVGSYTDPSFVGLIVMPVADENLSEFLRNVPTLSGKEKESQRKLLWSFFGCLANALAHLHFVFMIRHKDIKPQNILVGYEPEGLRAMREL